MKHLLIIITILILSGCTTRGMFSGNYEETIAINEQTGQVLLHPITRQPIRVPKRRSKEAIGFEQAAQAVKFAALAPPATSECDPLTPEQILQLGESAKIAYLMSSGNCKTLQIVATMINESPIEMVAKSFGQAIGKVSEEGTKKVKAFTDPIAAVAAPVLLTRSVMGAVSNGFDRLADVGEAAAATGNVHVGEVNVSQSQHGSASGVGGSASSGEGQALGGAGQGSSSNSRSGTDSTAVVIGNGNYNATAFDDGSNLVGTTASQQLEESANGGITNGSKTNGNQVADQLEGDNTANDEDGIKLD